MDKAGIATMIKEARKKAGLTQTQLAEMIGTKKEGVSRMESGKTEVEIPTLRKIATALKGTLKIEIDLEP